MQEVEYVATGNVVVRGGEAGDIRIGGGECGGAQIEARREALDDAAHDALRVAGLDLALDRHGKLAEWALGSEHMGDVAESVLVLIEPAIRGTSMRQRATYWPSWLRGVNRSIWITLVAGVW